MCGIISVVRRPGRRTAPPPDAVTGPLHEAIAALASPDPLVVSAHRAADHVEVTNRLLDDTDGVTRSSTTGACSPKSRAWPPRSPSRSNWSRAASTPAWAEAERPEQLEAINAAVVRLKDAVWVGRARTAPAPPSAVADLAGSEPGWAATEGYTSIQQALSAIDRLEVRGRDSAGLHILVHGHGLDLASPAIAGLIGQRADDPLFRSGTVRVVDGSLCLRLQGGGRDRRAGRQHPGAARGHPVRRPAAPGAQPRRTPSPSCWATPGGPRSASSPSPTPTRSTAPRRPARPAPTWWPPSTATSTTSPTSRPPPASTSPPRSPPTPRSSPRSWPGTWPTATAWSTPSADTVAGFEGSVAIGAATAADARPGAAGPARQRPGALRRPRRRRLHRGQRALRPGRGHRPLPAPRRRDAGQPRQPHRQPGPDRGPRRPPGGHARRHRAGGLRRHPPARGGARADRGVDHHPRHRPRRLPPLPAQGDHRGARQRSARRCGASSSSATGSLDVVLPADDALPADVRAALRSGDIRRVLVIGQGTAAVAGEALAVALRAACATTPLLGRGAAGHRAVGLRARPKMADTLVVAISQSGTTTDTNRTVDLVRERGAAVVAIVNRRGSDLTDKADGVLYTSDGRDVEMSRRLHQGVLQPGGGRLPAGRRPSPTRWAAPSTRPCWPPCRELPTAMAEVLGPARDDRRGRPQPGPAQALLGGRRQRREPHRRRRGADQALRALLQVDRLRPHRGQEAHRPVGRAAHPRVRRRPHRVDRRRRGQGGGDLPGAQGVARS